MFLLILLFKHNPRIFLFYFICFYFKKKGGGDRALVFLIKTEGSILGVFFILLVRRRLLELGANFLQRHGLVHAVLAPNRKRESASVCCPRLDPR